MGLDGLIAARAGSLHGIVNGIDTDVWNPETDPLLPATYSARKLQARATNRAALAGRFGLHNDDTPLFVLVSRLTWQKGIDLLAWITAQDIVRAGHRLAVLGTGEPGLEHDLPLARRRVPRPRRRRHRLRRAARPPDAGRRRRHPHPLALRALRPDPALRPALRLRPHRRPHRRPRRHRHRRQHRRPQRQRRHRLPVHPRRRRPARRRHPPRHRPHARQARLDRASSARA